MSEKSKLQTPSEELVKCNKIHLHKVTYIIVPTDLTTVKCVGLIPILKYIHISLCFV